MTVTIRDDATQWMPYYVRAGVWHAKGESAKALSDLTKAIELNPEVDPESNRSCQDLAEAWMFPWTDRIEPRRRRQPH